MNRADLIIGKNLVYDKRSIRKKMGHGPIVLGKWHNLWIIVISHIIYQNKFPVGSKINSRLFSGSDSFSGGQRTCPVWNIKVN